MDDFTSMPGRDDITERLITVVKNLPRKRQRALLDALEKEKQATATDNEQRQYSRKDVLLPVDYASYDQCFRDFIKDISEGGVFIETKQPFVSGHKIAMTFMATDNKHHFKINGKIVRDAQNGIGVKFDKLMPEQVTQIKAFLSAL